MTITIWLVQMTVDVHNHDEGCIHNDSEVDGSHSNQVSGIATYHHHDEGEKKGQWDRQSNDERSSKIAQECQKDHRDQDHAFHKSVSDGMSGDVDEIGSVVIGNDKHSFREDAFIDLVNFLPHALESWQGLLAASHQNDSLHDRRFFVLTDLSNRNFRSDTDPSQLLEINRCTVLGRNCDICNIIGILEKADAADVVALNSNLQIIRPYVGVAAGHCADHLRYRDIERDQFVRI